MSSGSFRSALEELTMWTLSFFFFLNLVIPCDVWDLSSLTCSPCSGSTESQPLGCQGSPFFSILIIYSPNLYLTERHLCFCPFLKWILCLVKGNRLAALEKELLYSQNRYNQAVTLWNFSLPLGNIRVLFRKSLLWCAVLNSMVS